LLKVGLGQPKHRKTYSLMIQMKAILKTSLRGKGGIKIKI